MATFKASILTSKKNLKNDGTANIKIRITHKSSQVYIKTELYILPKDFNISTGRVDYGKNRSHINLSITEWLLKCQKADIELGSKRNYMSVAEIKKHILKTDEHHAGIDFFAYTEDLVKRTKQSATAEDYAYCARRIKSFAGPVLPFSEITLNFLNRFEEFLYNQGVRNGIVNYMKSFRAIFNKARDDHNNEDLQIIPIPNYPFRKYKMPGREESTKDKQINKHEITLLMNYKPVSPGEEFAKDVFMLMIYLIGIETKDLFYLKKAINGRIVYKRFKTGKLYSIKIEPEAQTIIDKYPGQDTLLNFSQRFKQHESFIKHINNYLHGIKCKKITGIFPKLGSDKKVSTKWARHTWATIARNDCRIHKDDVALCLGHEDKDNKVTDIYIKYDYSIIDDSNRKLIDYILTK